MREKLGSLGWLPGRVVFWCKAKALFGGVALKWAASTPVRPRAPTGRPAWASPPLTLSTPRPRRPLHGVTSAHGWQFEFHLRSHSIFHTQAEVLYRARGLK